MLLEATLHSFRRVISKFYQKFTLEHCIVLGEEYGEMVMVYVSCCRGEGGGWALRQGCMGPGGRMQIFNLHVSSCVQNVYVCLHISHMFSTRLSPRRGVGNFGFRMNISFRRQFQFTLNFMPPPTSYGLGHTGFKIRVIFWFSLDCRPQQRLAG